MNEQQKKLIGWQHALLNEVAGIAYRIPEPGMLPPAFYHDLAFALRRLSERVERESPKE